MTPTPEQIEAAKKWVLENIDNAYGFEGTAEHVWLSDWLAEYAAHRVAEATAFGLADAAAEITRLREQLAASQAECIALQNRMDEHVTAWRPIAEAPKDELLKDRRVLVHWEWRDEGVLHQFGCEIAEWNERFQRFIKYGSDGDWMKHITHYLHLPAPPKDETK